MQFYSNKKFAAARFAASWKACLGLRLHPPKKVQTLATPLPRSHTKFWIQPRRARIRIWSFTRTRICSSRIRFLSSRQLNRIYVSVTCMWRWCRTSTGRSDSTCRHSTCDSTCDSACRLNITQSVSLRVTSAVWLTHKAPLMLVSLSMSRTASLTQILHNLFKLNLFFRN